MFYEAQTTNVISIATNPFLNIAILLSYPSEINSQYQGSGYGDRNILSSLAVAAADRSNNQAWTIIGIPAEASLNGFLSLHVNFLNTYEEVQINKDLLALVFGMSVAELYPFRFFQEITATQTIDSSGFIDQ